MSLIDAVLPDIISLRHSLAGNKIIKSDIAFKSDGIGEDIYHINSAPMDSVDYNGLSIDGGNHKVMLLKGHESEVYIKWNQFYHVFAN